MGGSVQIRIRYPWAQRLIWIGLIQIRENNLAQSLDPDQPDPDRKTNGEAGTFDFFEIKKSLKKPLEGLFPDPDRVRIFPQAKNFFPKKKNFFHGQVSVFSTYVETRRAKNIFPQKKNFFPKSKIFLPKSKIFLPQRKKIFFRSRKFFFRSIGKIFFHVVVKSFSTSW